MTIGQKKKNFIAWALKNGWKLIDAQKYANSKYGFERKGRYAILVDDFCRMSQYSFGGDREIIEQARLDSRKVEEIKIFAQVNHNYCDDEELEKILKEQGFKIKKVYLFA